MKDGHDPRKARKFDVRSSFGIVYTELPVTIGKSNRVVHLHNKQATRVPNCKLAICLCGIY